MTWKPTSSKILNFGEAWLDNMLIPETDDDVLGHDDPGVVPVAIGSMGSASGQAFAYVENNLQYLHDIMVIDNVTINVNNVAELQAALDILDRVIYVHKDKTFLINVAAGTYAWPDSGTESRAAFEVIGVTGGGIVQINCASVIIEGDCETNRPLVNVKNCRATVLINALTGPTLSNTAAAGDAAVRVENSRYVVINGLHVKNKTVADTLDQAVYCKQIDFLQLALTANVVTGLDTGIERAIYAESGSSIYIASSKLTVGKLTIELFYLSRNSEIIFENFDSCLPLGSNMALISQVATIDQSSRITAKDISSSGTGTGSDPYVITVAWESATQTPLLVNLIIALLPKPLDVWVKIKLPANTFTDGFLIEDINGAGGLIIEANTALVAKSTAQDSIIDSASEGITIKRCKASILISSMKVDNDTGNAAIYVQHCRDVRIFCCYLIAATGTGASPLFGNAFFVSGGDSHLEIYFCKVGDCDQNGIFAYLGGRASCIDTDSVDMVSNLPTQWGNYARLGGIITRSDTATEFLTGLGGGDSEDTGGKVFAS